MLKIHGKITFPTKKSNLNIGLFKNPNNKKRKFANTSIHQAFSATLHINAPGI